MTDFVFLFTITINNLYISIKSSTFALEFTKKIARV